MKYLDHQLHQHQHRLMALLMFYVAYVSPSRFPGASGWVGAFGLLLLGVVSWNTTTEQWKQPRLLRHAPFRVGAVALGLTGMALSIILWKH